MRRRIDCFGIPKDCLAFLAQSRINDRDGLQWLRSVTCWPSMRLPLILLCLALVGCASQPKHVARGDLSSGGVDAPVLKDAPLDPVQEKEMSGLEGKKIDALISQLGVPDRIESAKNYGMIFSDGEASVVFLYDRIKIRVYVMQDCTVLGVTAVHEMRGNPLNRPASNRKGRP